VVGPAECLAWPNEVAAREAGVSPAGCASMLLQCKSRHSLIEWLKKMEEPSTEADRLRAELIRIDDEIRNLRSRFRRGIGWQLWGRPFGVRVPANSALIFMAFTLFNLSALGAGIGLTIATRGALNNLGIALVVGALFAFGSFMAQWWTVQAQVELDFTDRITGTAQREEQIGKLRSQIVKRLEHLEQSEQER